MADNPEGSSGQGVTSEPNTQASIAGDSPPSVSAPVRHGDELAQSALSIIEEHAKAIAPSPEEVDALQKMLTPSGQVTASSHNEFLKKLQELGFPWLSKNYHEQRMIPAVIMQCDDAKADAGEIPRKPIPTLAAERVGLRSSENGEAVDLVAIAPISCDEYLGAIGGRLSSKAIPTVVSQLTNAVRYPRMFGIEIQKKMFFLHLFNGGNSIFYFLRHTCSPIAPFPLQATPPCVRHQTPSVEDDAKDRPPRPVSTKPTPNVCLELHRDERGDVYCYVKATRDVRTNERLRLDWSCYPSMKETWDNGPQKERCNCEGSSCRKLRIGSQHPAYLWATPSRFRVPGKKFPVAYGGQTIDFTKGGGNPLRGKIRECFSVPHLSRAVHVGDFIVYFDSDDQVRPAQVLLIEEKRDNNSRSAFVTYRCCEWASDVDLFADANYVHPRGVYLTSQVTEFNCIYKRSMLPVAVLSLKESSKECSIDASSVDVYVAGWATARERIKEDKLGLHNTSAQEPIGTDELLSVATKPRQIRLQTWPRDSIGPPGNFFSIVSERVVVDSEDEVDAGGDAGAGEADDKKDESSRQVTREEQQLPDINEATPSNLRYLFLTGELKAIKDAVSTLDTKVQAIFNEMEDPKEAKEVKEQRTNKRGGAPHWALQWLSNITHEIQREVKSIKNQNAQVLQAKAAELEAAKNTMEAAISKRLTELEAAYKKKETEAIRNENAELTKSFQEKLVNFTKVLDKVDGEVAKLSKAEAKHEDESHTTNVDANVSNRLLQLESSLVSLRSQLQTVSQGYLPYGIPSGVQQLSGNFPQLHSQQLYPWNAAPSPVPPPATVAGPAPVLSLAPPIAAVPQPLAVASSAALLPAAASSLSKRKALSSGCKTWADFFDNAGVQDRNLQNVIEDLTKEEWVPTYLDEDCINEVFANASKYQLTEANRKRIKNYIDKLK